MSDEPNVVLEVSLERPFYELLRLEAAREENDHDSVEDLVRAYVWRELRGAHHEQSHGWIKTPVDIDADSAERLLLQAEFHRQTGSENPWWDTVDEFLNIEPRLVVDDEEITPDWVG